MILYTDGAYSMKRNRGGIGYLAIDETTDELLFEVSLPYHNQTSQRAELMAVIEALTRCSPDEHVTVRTDSEYIVEGFAGNYNLVKNTDLWDELNAVAAQIRVKMEYIPRRSDEWACMVDDLAKAGKDIDDA